MDPGFPGLRGLGAVPLQQMPLQIVKKEKTVRGHEHGASMLMDTLGPADSLGKNPRLLTGSGRQVIVHTDKTVSRHPEFSVEHLHVSDIPDLQIELEVFATNQERPGVTGGAIENALMQKRGVGFHSFRLELPQGSKGFPSKGAN